MANGVNGEHGYFPGEEEILFGRGVLNSSDEKSDLEVGIPRSDSVSEDEKNYNEKDQATVSVLPLR